MGMIPLTVTGAAIADACPHTRGDDPNIFVKRLIYHILVPTRVGMIPITQIGKKAVIPCPHTRGDDPKPAV